MDKGTSLNMKCGVVILNYNSHDLTVALAKKVSAYECVDYICVVDNCSKDSFDGDFQEAKIHYIKSKKNDGYSAGNNIGLRYLVDEKKCDRVFIANPDVLFDERTIWEMSRTFDKKDDLVILSTKRYGHDKATIHQWFDFPILNVSIKNCFFMPRRKFEKRRHFLQNMKIDLAENIVYVDAVPGAFLGIRSEFLKKIGFLYEGIFLYGDEIYLGQQARELGYKVGVINTVTYIHDHVQRRFSNRKMFWLDRQSLKIYYRKFENYNFIQWAALNAAIVLGYAEYSCAYILYNLLKGGGRK